MFVMRSAPLPINRRNISGSSVAGPSVQMIFVFRIEPAPCPKNKAAHNSARAASEKQTAALFQFALRFLGHIEVFLDHLCRSLGEFLQIRIASIAGLALELSQIVLVIFHHRVHVILV